jgi:hypothetical protein
MNKTLTVVLSVIFLIGCSNKNKDTSITDSHFQNVINESLPLVEGAFTLENDVFGQTIDLKGTSHPIANFFEVKELEMLATDSLLIVKNKNGDNIFMLYSLPDFHFLQSFGRIGKGPNEFQFPNLIKSNSSKAICYIQEWRKSKLLVLEHSLKLRQLPVRMPLSNMDRQICSINDSNYFVVAIEEGKKSISELKFLQDTLISNFCYNLSFSKNLNNWTSYIGDFALNYDKKRLIYAYKYFKRILFIDIVNKKGRVIQFDDQNVETDLIKNPLGPGNITYYWGISSNKNYVYFLYSGRTPIEVTKELKSGPGYIYVEQFDWNGNPIRKYRLDHWGYFCVSNDEKTIYLASVADEQPFYSYIIPELASQP